MGLIKLPKRKMLKNQFKGVKKTIPINIPNWSKVRRGVPL